MNDLKIIQKKLEEFTRKYYWNELLKGALLFFSVWVLYILLTISIEYFFWLPPTFRSILFWLFIAVTAILIYKFLLIPVLKLVQFKKGIDSKEASKIIGDHFADIGDKLLNIIQLGNNSDKSELIMASISQRSSQLSPVPFQNAINYKGNLRYLKFAILPIILILLILLTGKLDLFSQSYTRVLHYDLAYEPPAPYSFHILNDNLQVEEGKDLVLKVTTQGDRIPENVEIVYEGQSYFLKKESVNQFSYTLENVKRDLDFNLKSNEVNSRPYHVAIVEVPKLLDFSVFLQYPKYLGLIDKTVKGTGNIDLPEGTKLQWRLSTASTQEVHLHTNDTIINFLKDNDIFKLEKTILAPFNYGISSSNSQVKDYERLDYRLNVIKDQFPQLDLETKKDSSYQETYYFKGRASDDHAISLINLVYSENGSTEKNVISVAKPNSPISEFLAVFPGDIKLKDGKNYNFYLEAFDNDGVNGAKSVKSETFSFSNLTKDQLNDKLLQEQDRSLNDLGKSLDKFGESDQELKEFSQLQKQKEQLNYSDKKQLDSYLDRQKMQTELMKEYSEKLSQLLQKQEENRDSEMNKELQERLEKNNEQLEENEKLREELEKYSDRIDREELSRKLEELSRKNSFQQKSLEQLLELTKRYYVQEKSKKLTSDLEKLGERQENLSKETAENNLEKQKKANEDFKDLQKEMDSLQKENEVLKKPMEMPRDQEEEKDIQDDQEGAQKNLEQKQEKSAKEKQKSAGEKMNKLSKKMKMAEMMSQSQQLNANIDTMRQILDNLMTFSFEQEDLLKKFKEIDINNPGYAGNLKQQQVLKEHFEHIDDSLFTLALSNPMITEPITSKISDIDFDLDKSLERLAQNELPQGLASQQYVMTNTNELANMLNDVLSNMEQQASGNPNGQGSGQGMQLPDIIESQEALKEKMEKALQNGKGNDGEEKGKDKNAGKEEMSGEQYEIYKQQQQLRMALEEKLKQGGLSEANTRMLEEMEKMEREILDKGINSETIKRMNDISHKLLEMKNSLLEQEEDNKRKSQTNQKQFSNTLQDQLLKAKEYFKSTEILNRQSLPLRQNYQDKVREYFNGREN